MNYNQVMETQYGGNHYKERAIQPWEIWEAYDLNGWEASALKYLLRYKDKGKALEDLYKCMHNVQYLIAKEERRLMAEETKQTVNTVINNMVGQLTT
jgi:hypothetical protein